MTEPLRVLHLLKGLGPGGAERLVVAQVTGPGTTVHQVAYLLEHKAHLVPLLEDVGVRCICLAGSGVVRPGWMRRLRRELYATPVDILHTHSPAVAAAARLIVRTLPRRSRPVVVGTEHNRWPRHHFLTRLANRLTIRLDQATIAVSGDVASTIAGTRPDQVRVVAHGIDLEAVRAMSDRAAVRDELGLIESDVAVVCVANLRVEKSLDVLVDAARIALTAERRLRFFLIGQGPLAAEVDTWIDKAGIGDRFTALGYRDDAPRVVSGADIFTLSSAHEGLPVAIMEALTLGVPIVATAAGGVPEAAGNAGRITAVGDAAALAANYVALARDPAARSSLAAAGRLQSERFSIARAVVEIEASYTVAMARTATRSKSHS